MPIFEFTCDRCGKRFERLVFASSKDPVPCPDCGSVETMKLFSVFASAGGGKSAGSCSTHGGG